MKIISPNKENNDTSCPVCDGQGNIYNAKVVDLGIIIKICDECEACWRENQLVALKKFKGLTLFLKENNLTYERATIEDLEYVQEKYKCPCCEFKTLDSASGLFDICPICYWEDDNIQRDDPYYKGGANAISLNEARQNYRKIGAISSEYLIYVRSPLEDEN